MVPRLSRFKTNKRVTKFPRHILLKGIGRWEPHFNFRVFHDPRGILEFLFKYPKFYRIIAPYSYYKKIHKKYAHYW